jgi:hypothetical protein
MLLLMATVQSVYVVIVDIFHLVPRYPHALVRRHALVTGFALSPRDTYVSVVLGGLAVIVPCVSAQAILVGTAIQQLMMLRILN